MAFKADQPRIPKGFVGAGRFMKVGQVLTALKDVSHPGDSGRRGVREPRLAKAGSKLSRRDEAVERTFAGAARASKAPAAPKAPRAEADAEGTAKSKPKRGSLANAGAKLAQTKTATSSHLAALRAAETRADAEAALAGLRGADLKQIARELSVDPNRPVAELRQAIIERTVGARINSRAVRGL